jgi:hypothetical protein
MRYTLFISLSLLLAVLFAGCKKLDSARGKENAKSLTNGVVCTVVDSTADRAPSRSIYSSDQGDCMADLVVAVRPANSQYVYQLGIDHTNPQFQNYMRLRVGDKVSFEYSDEPLQAACGSGAFIKIKY